MKSNFETVPTIFTRLKGKNGRIREYRALISPSSEYCIIPQVDAHYLGSNRLMKNIVNATIYERNNLALTCSGYVNALLTVIDKVEIGSISIDNVEFVEYDLPQETCFDIILGQNAFRHNRITIDYKVREIIIEG
jgi:hypothetical protein